MELTSSKTKVVGSRKRRIACYLIFIISLFIFFYFSSQWLYSTQSSIFQQMSNDVISINCARYNFGELSPSNIPIYDFFIFNNELDMLEIRLYELYDYVTQFLIVESNQTFTGKSKLLYLKEHWSRFTRYHNKIRRIEVKLMPVVKPDDAWSNEQRMRDEGIRLALSDAPKYEFVELLLIFI